jgi:hypothetical protein
MSAVIGSHAGADIFMRAEHTAVEAAAAQPSHSSTTGNGGVSTNAADLAPAKPSEAAAEAEPANAPPADNAGDSSAGSGSSAEPVDLDLPQASIMRLAKAALGGSGGGALNKAAKADVTRAASMFILYLTAT